MIQVVTPGRRDGARVGRSGQQGTELEPTFLCVAGEDLLQRR